MISIFTWIDACNSALASGTAIALDLDSCPRPLLPPAAFCLDQYRHMLTFKNTVNEYLLNELNKVCQSGTVPEQITTIDNS